MSHSTSNVLHRKPAHYPNYTMTDDNKQWIPLECNPKVFNELAKKAGLISSQATFQDVYGLDDELLGMVPQPVKAVILIFPEYKEVVERRKAEDAKFAKDGQTKLDKTIFWVKQTIGNACGTMAIIHTLANTDVTLSPGSPLATYISQCSAKTPDERAKILETTPSFAKLHAEFAEGGESRVPADLQTDLHYTCFVAAPEAEFRDRAGAAVGVSDEEFNKLEDTTGMRLVELDGTREGPVDRGECKDLLKDVAAFVKTRYLSQTSSVEFSMLALGPAEDN